MARATILFPADYFSPDAPNDNFSGELDAVIATEGLESALFNYDEFIDGASLTLSEPIDHLPELVIYRGWMMKPEQYRRFHDELVSLGLKPMVSPLCYERMHCFPNAAEMFGDQTPPFMAFPEADGTVRIDADIVNERFDRFMIKDYVKSAKNTDFPAFIETPVTQDELDSYIDDFIRRRGTLFTSGIVLKEYVDLKRYEGAINEWRHFIFLQGARLGLNRNSCQPPTTPEPPDSYLSTRNIAISPFYTVDYAELADGTWVIIEAGDGQVSGLAESDDPMRFYETMATCLARFDRSDFE